MRCLQKSERFYPAHQPSFLCLCNSEQALLLFFSTLLILLRVPDRTDLFYEQMTFHLCKSWHQFLVVRQPPPHLSGKLIPARRVFSSQKGVDVHFWAPRFSHLMRYHGSRSRSHVKFNGEKFYWDSTITDLKVFCVMRFKAYEKMVITWWRS